jgi:hypothetical protein
MDKGIGVGPQGASKSKENMNKNQSDNLRKEQKQQKPFHSGFQGFGLKDFE